MIWIFCLKVVGQANRAFGLEIVAMSGHVLYPIKWDDELSHNFKTFETGNKLSKDLYSIFYIILPVAGDYKFCLQNANFAETRVVLSVNGMNAKKYMEQLKDVGEREKLEQGIAVRKLNLTLLADNQTK